MMAVRQANPPRASKKSNKFNKIKKKDDKKAKEKTPEKVSKPKTVNKVLLVEQEIKFALKLAGNDKKASDKVLKNLKKWLTYRSASTQDFSEYDFIRLWKGLFYCVWMSDKPLVQEDLCESIAGLFECFGATRMATSCLFYKCFLLTMAQNWIGIDQHRIDKFLMLVRRVTRAIFKCAKEQNWSKESMELVTEALSGKRGLLSADPPKESRNSLGLLMHISDCWMEEIAKISEGNLNSEALTELCRPYAQYLSYGDEPRLSSAIVKNIFTHLIRQTDLGIDYQDKLLAWRNAGYPGGNIDSMEKVNLSDEESEEEIVEEEIEEAPKKKLPALDPRAGFVDTVLPQLPVDGEMIASLLRSMVSDPRSTSNNRNKLKSVSQHFEVLASGVYPFKAKDVTLPNDPRFKLPKAAKAAQELLDYEKNCADQYDEDDMKGLNKRQRRKLLMAQRKQLESGETGTDNEQEETNIPAKKKQKKTMLDGWQVEDMPIFTDNSALETSKSVSLKTHPLRQNRDKNNKTKNNLKKSNKSDNNSTPINRKGIKKATESANKSLKNDASQSNGVAKENSSVMNTEEGGTPKSNKKIKLHKSLITTPLGNSQQKNVDDAQKTMSQSRQKKSPDDIAVSELERNTTTPTNTPKTKQKKTPASSSGAGQKKSNSADAVSPAIKQKKSTANLSIITQQKIFDTSDTMITSQKKQKKTSANLTNGDISACLTPNNVTPKSVLKEFKAKNWDTSTPVSGKKNKKNETLKSPADDKTVSTESVPKKVSDTPKGKLVKNNVTTPQNKIIPKDLTNAKKPLNKKSANKSMSETEIFIPNRVASLKSANKRLNSSDSGILKGKKTQINSNLSMDSNSPGSKKVMIALKKNTAQSVMDFFKSVKQSPEIPFDGGKKPLKTSLKPNSIPSPINPFYKKKLNL